MYLDGLHDAHVTDPVVVERDGDGPDVCCGFVSEGGQNHKHGRCRAFIYFRHMKIVKLPGRLVHASGAGHGEHKGGAGGRYRRTGNDPGGVGAGPDEGAEERLDFRL